MFLYPISWDCRIGRKLLGLKKTRGVGANAVSVKQLRTDGGEKPMTPSVAGQAPGT